MSYKTRWYTLPELCACSRHLANLGIGCIEPEYLCDVVEINRGMGGAFGVSVENKLVFRYGVDREVAAMILRVYEDGKQGQRD